MSTYEVQMLSSSSDAIYTVVCRHEDGIAFGMNCDCPAGQFGDLCKHLISIFGRDARFLCPDKPEYTQDFQSMCDSFEGSAFRRAYDGMLDQLDAIKAEQDALKQAAKDVKLAFVRSLNTQ